MTNEEVKNRLEKLKDSYNLSADQKWQISDILEIYDHSYNWYEQARPILDWLESLVP